MEIVSTAQVLGFFIWLFFITAGTFTLMFIICFIPVWMSFAFLERFNKKLADKLFTFMLEF